MNKSGEQFVADHVSGLPRSGIRDFFAIVQAMPQAISLGIGEPDFVTPWHIREAAIFALEKGKTSYTDNLGLIRLRREISIYVENQFGISYHPENEVLVAVGVSEALDIALRAVLNPGDKVIYHEPCYVSYSPSIKLAHAEPIAVATSAEDEFGIDPDAVEAAWEPGTKLLILNFPTISPSSRRPSRRRSRRNRGHSFSTSRPTQPAVSPKRPNWKSSPNLLRRKTSW